MLKLFNFLNSFKRLPNKIINLRYVSLKNSLFFHLIWGYFRLKAEYNGIRGWKIDTMTILREVRELQDLSMKALSINVNIPVSTLYDVETGRRSIGASNAIEISKYYNVSVEELFIPTYYRVKVV